MFIGYELSFNLIMSFKLAGSNEAFIKSLLIDSNYTLLYEKNDKNLFNKLFSKVLNVNKPVSILNSVFHFKKSENNSKTFMAYVNNPHVDEKSIDKDPEVFIYNTHQGERYMGNGLEGYNITPGVMMASYILQNKLADNDIKSLVLEDNISEYMNLNSMDYSKSYIASRKFIEGPISDNSNLKLILDIHRDSISKDKSTVIINNKSCAKILFVIGEEYDNYNLNLDMTSKLNNMIEEKYPNLTRGVLTKGGKGSNGVYNQDLNVNMTLLEIGAEENTIDEVLNTIELIAPIIGDYVNGK